MRTREQTYSNLIGLHVNAGSLLTDQRLDEYARAVAGRSVGQARGRIRFGFIRRWAATDAAAYEGRRLRQGLLDKSNAASGVWADTAYRSAANETFLNKNGFVSHINRKKPKGRAIRIVGPPHRQWSFHQGRAQSPRDFNSRPGIHSG